MTRAEAIRKAMGMVKPIMSDVAVPILDTYYGDESGKHPIRSRIAYRGAVIASHPDEPWPLPMKGMRGAGRRLVLTRNGSLVEQRCAANRETSGRLVWNTDDEGLTPEEVVESGYQCKAILTALALLLDLAATKAGEKANKLRERASVVTRL